MKGTNKETTTPREDAKKGQTLKDIFGWLNQNKKADKFETVTWGDKLKILGNEKKLRRDGDSVKQSK